MVTQTSACAALVYTVCEWAGGLVFEVANIWRKSTIPLHLRWIYILGRYVGLVGQICYIAALNYLINVPETPQPLCNLYWSAQVLLSIFGLSLPLFLASKRVYFLWDRDFRIGIILSLLVALVEVAALATGAVAVKSMQHQDHCLVMPHFPGEAIYGITVVTVVVQACIGGLGLVKATSLRRESFSTKLNWVVTRVSRESILVAALSCVLPASVIVDGIWSKFEADITVMTHLAFPVFLAISTSTSCRMIQSMHQVKKEVEEIPGSLLGEDSLVLTSIGFET